VLLGITGGVSKGPAPVPERGGAKAPAPHFNHVEAHWNRQMPSLAEILRSAVEQMATLGFVHRQARCDGFDGLPRTQATGLHLHKAEETRALQDNQIDFATAMGRTPVAQKAVISAIFKIAPRSVLTGLADTQLQPPQAFYARRK